MNKQKVCMTIAGVDPSGGAGVLADVRTFNAFGCFATAAIASLTFQNTTGVFGAVVETAETVRRQVAAVADDMPIAALKTGMLPTRGIIEETASLIVEYGLPNYVCDPVVRSTSGFDLIDDAALAALVERLFPLATLVTPNIPEAERITGTTIRDVREICAAAARLRELGAKNVLIKGGHLAAVDGQAVDYLFVGERELTFAADFIETTSTHGTGCTFAAAIAANLALGRELEEAVAISKHYVNAAIRNAPGLGRGHGPLGVGEV